MQESLSGSSRWINLGALIATLIVLSGCSHMLNMDGAKSAISAGLTEKLGMAIASVSCPESRAIKPGDSFDCKAVPQTGGELTVKVTQKDDQGNITWELTNPENLIQLSLLEEHIKNGLKEQSSVDATVDCGGKFRVSVPGKTFECTAKDTAGNQGAVTITMKDDKGNVAWQMNSSKR